MPTFTEIAAKIAKLFVATDKYHQIVNGPDNETVVVESGVLPTFAKTIKDFNANLPDFGGRKVVFVSKMSSATDDRGTLSKYNSFKPFRTIAAAIAAAVSGEMVVVMDGEFDDRITMKNGVDVYYTSSAKHKIVTVGNDIMISFEEGADCNIFGEGTFEMVTNDGYGIMISQGANNARLREFNAKKVVMSLGSESSDPYRGSNFINVMNGIVAAADQEPEMRVNIDKFIYSREGSADQKLFYVFSSNTRLFLNINSLEMPKPIDDPGAANFLGVVSNGCQAELRIKSFYSRQAINYGFTSFNSSKIRYFGDVVDIACGSGMLFDAGTNSAVYAQIGIVHAKGTNGDNTFVLVSCSSSTGSTYINVGTANLFDGASIAIYYSGSWHRISGHYYVHQGEGSVRGIRHAANGTLFCHNLIIDMADIYSYAVLTTGGANYSIFPQNAMTNAAISLGGGSTQGPDVFYSAITYFPQFDF